MKYVDNWEGTKQRFISWWNHEDTGRPMMRILARMKDCEPNLPQASTYQEMHLDAAYRVNSMRAQCSSYKFYAEAFPYVCPSIGPGSMATYLGCKPNFDANTVWYNEIKIESLEELGQLEYGPDSYWWKKHIEEVSRAVTLANGDFPVCIPDIEENIDILSAIRGPQNLCFDIMDEPDMVHKYIKEINIAFYRYFDKMYNIVKDIEGSSSYTAFGIWSPADTAKIQCDFSALMSPGQFNEFVLPGLTEQCKRLSYTMYHLDGPDAIRHVDSVLSIEGLNALQWSPGAGQPDGGSEKWYPIYERALNAGKSLWIQIYDGEVDTWAQRAKAIIKRFGSRGIYFYFGDTDCDGAETILKWLA